jgi:hypothetical protein
MDRGGGVGRVIGRVRVTRIVDRSPSVGRALVDDLGSLEGMPRPVAITPTLRSISHGQIVSFGPIEPRQAPVSLPRDSIISLNRPRSAEI